LSSAHPAQIGIDTALHDPEQRLRGAAARTDTALGPARRQFERRLCARTIAGNGVHSSSAIMISLPSACWISIALSGVSTIGAPSRCDRKRMPPSSIRIDLRQAHRLKASGIRQDRAAKAHETPDSAHLMH